MHPIRASRVIRELFGNDGMRSDKAIRSEKEGPHFQGVGAFFVKPCGLSADNPAVVRRYR